MITRTSLDPKLVFKFTKTRVLYVSILSLIATLLYCTEAKVPFNLSTPVSILGGALAFMLAFKNDSAYNRWWDAAKTWESLASDSRHFASQVDAFIGRQHLKNVTPDEINKKKAFLIKRHIAFIYALNYYLRNKDVLLSPVLNYLSEGEVQMLKERRSIPNAMLQNQQHSFMADFYTGLIEDFEYLQLDGKLNQFFGHLGMLESIKNTIFPRQYAAYGQMALWMFLTLLPFSVTNELGYLTFPVCVSVSFFYIVLEYLGRHLESPFENTVNDVPMDSICRNIEIDLLEVLHEKEIPKPIQPTNGYLF